MRHRRLLAIVIGLTTLAIPLAAARRRARSRG